MSLLFRCELEVRDYELDMQGIVNHATYVNYLEYARQRYANEKGIDIYAYHQQGYDLMLSGLELKFKLPLGPRDQFYVTANPRREGRLRLVFDQEIRKQGSDELVLKAKATIICLNLETRRPCMPAELVKVFEG